MRRIIIFCCVIFIISCRKVQEMPTPSAPNVVGSLSVYPNPTSGNVTMSFNVEPSVKYSLIVADMRGNSYKTYAISSATNSVVKQENLSTLDNGTYDLVLIDITGKEYRTPIIIKK